MTAIHGQRVAAAATLLGILVLLNATAPTIFPLVVSGALVIAPTICWAATYYFTQLALLDALDVAAQTATHDDGSPRTEPIRSLRDRAQTSLLLAIASTAASLLGWIVVLRAFGFIPPIPRETFLIGLSFALLLIAGPAGNWLVTWRPWERH